MSTRRLKRRQLLFYLPAIDLATGKKIGNVVDITSEGMMVVSEEVIETEQEFTIRIDLPQPVRGHSSLRLVAKSLWSRPDPNPRLCDTGFRIIKLRPSSATTLQYLIDRFAFDN